MVNTDVEIDEIVVEAGANIQILGGSSLTVTGDIRNDGTVQVGSEASLVQTTGSTLTTASGTYLVRETVALRMTTGVLLSQQVQ